MKRVEKHHVEALKLALEESKSLAKEKNLNELSAQEHVITSWLGRRKARKRATELVAARLVEAHGQLRQALRLSQESAAKLENELQQSRRREAELQAEYQCLKHRLTLAQFRKFA